jgi:hypothetical protein
MIVGIAAATRYLGYDKPDSFRRARTRHPHPRREPDRRRPARHVRPDGQVMIR